MLVSMEIYEHWIQHLCIFERLRNPNLLTDQEKTELIRLTLMAEPFKFYGNPTQLGSFPHSDQVQASHEIYDSPTKGRKDQITLVSASLRTPL